MTTGAPRLTRNPVSIVGAWLTTLAGFAFLTFYALEVLGLVENPYAGMVGFVALPALFLLGLVLIPTGVWSERRRRRKGREPWPWPAIDLGQSRTRAIGGIVAVLTLVNVAIVTVATSGALHYMETNAFCGTVCHTPMRPQATAHAEWPHAQVSCVSCHVGPGAAGTFRAKMNGARRAWQFMGGSFARPIRSPAESLPAVEGTCIGCHAIDRMAPVTTIVKKTYDEDEANTETVATLDMFSRASHWHARADVVVEYLATDESRETIPYVRVTRAGQAPVEYVAASAPDRPAGPWRRMDCLDCHNRPAHTQFPSAGAAVDSAIAAGEIAPSLPYARREAVKALTTNYPDEASALDAIRRGLDEFYQTTAASAADVARATAAVERLYRTNVFPDMKVTWGTYRSQLAHIESSGCFRCHDDDHKSPAGELVRQDCELCHLEK